MRPKHPEPEIPEWGVYCCSGCGQLLALERVLSATVERHEGQATGYILFRHYCPCRPDEARISRRWGSHPSFLALFGTMPALPYESSFRWRPVSEDDPAVVRWAWELGQLADADEFMLFANEAARRHAA